MERGPDKCYNVKLLLLLKQNYNNQIVIYILKATQSRDKSQSD